MPMNNGARILEALGLDTRRVLSATITFGGRFPIIDVKSLANVNDDQLCEELKKFKLVEIKEGEAL